MTRISPARAVGKPKDLAQMSHIWRFYVDQDRRWRWQRFTADRVLISESRAAYTEYEGCLANAQDEGYVFHPSQSKLVRVPTR